MMIFTRCPLHPIDLTVVVYPGAMVSVRGKIFTDIYATNETVASNNRKTRVIRSYMGGKTCELRDPVADD